MLSTADRRSALVALAGAALALWANAGHGPGLSPESAGYVSAARSLAGLRGLLWYDGGPLLAQPPLYPAVLACAGLLTASDPLRAAGPVSVLLYLAAVAVAGAIASRRLHLAPGPAMFAAAAAAAAYPLFYVSAMTWPDLLLAALVGAALFAGDAYAARRTRGALAALAAFAAAASLARYSGAAVIAWAAIVVLAYGPGRVLARIGRAALFAAAASVPLAAWLAARPGVSAALLQSRPGASAVDVARNLEAAATGVVAWYAPVGRVGIAGPLAVMLLVAAAVFVVIRGSGRPGGHDAPPAGTVAGARIWVTAALALIFALAVVATTEAGARAQISDRALAPIAIPVAVLGACLLDLLLRARPAGRIVVLRKSVVAALVAGMLAWPVVRTVRAASWFSETGVGIAERGWQDSATAGYLLAHLDDLRAAPVYSNAPDAVYLLTGLRARWSPEKGPGPALQAGLWPPEGRAVLVWFSRRQTESLWPLEELSRVSRLQDLAILNDGRVLLARR
ncbi:MAG TPA: hypothetical protein PLN93_03080 [Vicinamibacterales bacterium]|nr:hypothetical protein [Vicinamibacterales bacterium]HPK70901.1 hypothetical protein [Vicinamibacterales bacterium]